MEIITDPRSSILHTECTDLLQFNLNTVSFLNDLARTMKKNVGVGLASPQVGIPLNAFVMLRNDGSVLKIVNPKITERGKIVTSRQEGCLSVPGKRVNMKRAKRIKVEFQNEIGEKTKLELRNFEAFVFQHELDHLRGILISD